MGGLFDRLKTWAQGEVVKSADLNAEFDNIINNITPSKIEGYSRNVSQMQVQTDPGAVNTESLSPSASGELERLRFAIARLLGKPLWYQSPSLSIEDVQNTLKSAIGLPRNRIVSGKKITGTNQPGFLQAAGSANSVSLLASTLEPFICFIDGVQYTFIANITFANLSKAPTANNTAAVNDASMAGQTWTKLQGEDKSKLLLTLAGSEITNVVGLTSAFKNPNGGEILMGRLEDANTILDALRGCFFDSTLAPVARGVLNNGDLLTLMRLTWIFLTKDGTLDVSYRPPVYSGTQPPSPTVGDYWFDIGNDTWKKYTSSGYVSANALFVGYSVQDGSNCVAARASDYFNVYSEDATLHLIPRTVSSVRSNASEAVVSVYGKKFQWSRNEIIWNYPNDLDVGVTNTTSKSYFFYLTDLGEPKISDVYPHNRIKDLRGWYHPHRPWRCIGGVFRDGSGNFDSKQLISFTMMKDEDFVSRLDMGMVQYDSSKVQIPGYIVAGFGASYAALEGRRDLLFRLFSVMGIASGQGDNTDTFTITDARGMFLRGTDTVPVNDPDMASRSAAAAGGNTAGNVGSYQGGQFASHNHGGGDHAHSSRYRNGMTTVQSGGGAQGIWFTFPASSANDSFTGTTSSGSGVIAYQGGNENRPVNIYATAFIKY